MYEAVNCHDHIIMPVLELKHLTFSSMDFGWVKYWQLTFISPNSPNILLPEIYAIQYFLCIEGIY